jgi:hypothetical protein
MSKKLNLTGNVYGRLTVIKRAGESISASGYKMPLWECICECKNKKIIRQQKLINGSTQSCGCLRKETATKHAKHLNLITDYKKYIKDNIKINKKTKCWEWTGPYFSEKNGIKGRPRTNIKYCGQTRVSRLAYQEFIEPFNKELYVCHTCDNPKCVNPDHLFLGTPQDNSTDMINKRRSLQGEKHHKAKLKNEDVIYILKNNNMPYEKLAKTFNVSKCTIRDIIKRRSWRHINAPNK